MERAECWYDVAFLVVVEVKVVVDIVKDGWFRVQAFRAFAFI